MPVSLERGSKFRRSLVFCQAVCCVGESTTNIPPLAAAVNYLLANSFSFFENSFFTGPVLVHFASPGTSYLVPYILGSWKPHLCSLFPFLLFYDTRSSGCISALPLSILVPWTLDSREPARRRLLTTTTADADEPNPTKYVPPPSWTSYSTVAGPLV